MDAVITRGDSIFSYDVARDGYNTNIIKAITGTPSASGADLTLNSADIVTFTAFRNLTGEVKLKNPVAPTTGQAKLWGFQNASDTFGSAYFQVVGAVFKVVVLDAAGAVLFSQNVTWQSAWTAAFAVFKISLTEHLCIFSVNGDIVATLDQNTAHADGSRFVFDKLSYGPLSYRVTNGNSDNLVINYIKAY